MSKNKLVSLTIGVSLVVQKDGKEEKSSYSLHCPSKSIKQPKNALIEICTFLNDELGTDFVVDWGDGQGNVSIVPPVQIKAHEYVSQDEYNKRIKELVPDGKV